MPYQLNGQSVAMKSQRLLHAAAGLVATGGGGVFVAMMVLVDTSAACAAPVSPRIIAARTARLFMLPPLTWRHQPSRSQQGAIINSPDAKTCHHAATPYKIRRGSKPLMSALVISGNQDAFG